MSKTQIEPLIVVVSGPVGVGKTTTAKVLSSTLRDHKICHAYFDLDFLSALYPKPNRDLFGQNLALTNLRSIWPNFERLGSKNVIISTIIDSNEFFHKLTGVFNTSNSEVVGLSASTPVLKERIFNRHDGNSKTWGLDRSKLLSKSLPTDPVTLNINTDNSSPIEIAAHIFQSISWIK